MKIIYAGSPEYAVAPLERLLSRGVDVAAVLTQPDKPAGRKRVLTPTPVKRFALAHNIPVFDFKPGENVEALKEVGADLMITCAYGRILTDEVLNAFPLGVYNLHASLLPRHRGASPIQAAILAGDGYTGVTVMKTVRALDSGDILLVKKTRIDGRTCGELSKELSCLSAEAAEETVDILSCGNPVLYPQDEAGATYCKKLVKADCAVDFNKTAAEVVNLINAMSPSPAAYAMLNGSAINLLKAHTEYLNSENLNGECGKVISADKNGIAVACADGVAAITALQFAGGKPICAADAVNGRKIKAGDRFD